MNDRIERGQHFSLVVAPVLAAFTLPTIALIVTQTSLHWRNIVLSLFVASTGLLLASFQLAVGSLFRDTPGWGQVRAFLAGLGLIFLAFGLILLMWSPNGGQHEGQYEGVLHVGWAFLIAGVLIPIGMTIWLWGEDHCRKMGQFRFWIGRHIRPWDEIRSLDAAGQSDQKPLSEEDISRIFYWGGDSYRIRALKLMQGDHIARSVDCILYSICQARSVFEVGQAFCAAEKLDKCGRRRISIEVRYQLGLNLPIGLSKRQRRIKNLLNDLEPNSAK